MRPVSFVHASRTCAGVHSLVSRSRVASRNAICSSVNAKCTCLLPREAEHALGDHVALDLVGARVDRARERELVALHPRRVVAVEQLGMAAEQIEAELVQL